MNEVQDTPEILGTINIVLPPDAVEGATETKAEEVCTVTTEGPVGEVPAEGAAPADVTIH